MSNDTNNIQNKPRLDLTKKLGEELGEIVFEQIKIHERFTSQNLTYFETRDLIEQMYAKIFELLYNEKYGKNK